MALDVLREKKEYKKVKIMAGWCRRILVYMKQDHPLKFDGAVANCHGLVQKSLQSSNGVCTN